MSPDQTAPACAQTPGAPHADPDAKARHTVGLAFDRSALGDGAPARKHLVPPPDLEAPADLDTWPEGALALARRGWEDRARSEYVGMLVLRRFHSLMVDTNGPMDLQELALTMELQEQRHASWCAAASRALGGGGAIAFERKDFQIARAGLSPPEELLRMLVGTFAVGEVVALALLRAAIRALPASGYRGVLERIVADEVLHGWIGPAVLAHVRSEAAPRFLPWPGDDWLTETVARQLEVMAARAVVAPDEVAACEDPKVAEALASVGLPHPVAFRAAYDEALADAVPKAFAKAGLPTP